MKSHIGIMYQTDNESATQPPTTTAITEESYIETRKHVSFIQVGEKKVAVPTVAHIQEIVKSHQTLTRQVKQLASDNRKMRVYANSLSAELSKLKNELANKLDKF